MFYNEAALALWKKDEEIFNLLKTVHLLKDPILVKTETTPDETYIIYFWNGIELDDSVINLLKTVRHALLAFGQEGEVLSDFQTEDFRGVDEEFRFILDWKPQFTIRDSKPFSIPEKKGNVWKETLIVPLLIGDYVEKLLNANPTCEEECFGEDEKISERVTFPNGFYVCIECIGVQYQEGEDNTAWCQGTLHSPDGKCVSFTEPEDDFFGTWEFYYKEDTYIVSVKGAKL